MNNILSKKTFIALLVLIVVALLVGLIPPRQLPTNNAPEAKGPYQVTMVGKMVCLPHKDTSGPTTLECTYGVMAVDGTYYALDLSAITMPVDSLSFEEDVYIEGLYTPVDELETDQWDIYNIEGSIRATNIGPTATATPNL